MSEQTEVAAPDSADRTVPNLTAGDVAARWNCTPRFVYQAAADGRLSHTKIGKLVRFSISDVEAFELREEATA